MCAFRWTGLTRLSFGIEDADSVFGDVAAHCRVGEVVVL